MQQQLESAVRIGKNGITPASILEIKKNLKKSKIIKIKLLKTAFEDRDQKVLLAQSIATQTKTTVQSIIGNTIVIARK